jgi:hypothetical protein
MKALKVVSMTTHLKKLLSWGLNGNSWGWFHCLAGGVIAKAVLMAGESPSRAVSAVVIIAVIWEGVEYFLETGAKPAEVYGSAERFYYDAAGDILLAIACAMLVV